MQQASQLKRSVAKNSGQINVLTDGSFRGTQAQELAKELQKYDLPRDVQISVGLDIVEQAAKSDAFKVHILDPQAHYDDFDIIFIPSHDPHPGRANIIETTGLINHISPEMLKGKERDFGLKPPYTAVLIGGRHVGGNFNIGDSLLLAKKLNDEGNSVVLTTSKRTENSSADALRTALKVPYVMFDFNHDGQAANPYEAMLASASKIVVTADSVRMMSEAASSGKAVEIFTPKEIHFSYHALGEAVLRAKLPLNEARRCAEIVAGKLK